jgi:hypothetical protein
MTAKDKFGLLSAYMKENKLPLAAKFPDCTADVLESKFQSCVRTLKKGLTEDNAPESTAGSTKLLLSMVKEKKLKQEETKKQQDADRDIAVGKKSTALTHEASILSMNQASTAQDIIKVRDQLATQPAQVQVDDENVFDDIDNDFGIDFEMSQAFSPPTSSKQGFLLCSVSSVFLLLNLSLCF